MAMVRDDIHGFDDVPMFQGGTHTKLRGDLFLVLLFTLAMPLGSKLLYGKDGTPILIAGLDETDGSASPTA